MEPVVPLLLAFYATSLFFMSLFADKLTGADYAMQILLVLMAFVSTLAVKIAWLPQYAAIMYVVLMLHMQITVLSK